jgi:hypothetical protein
MAKVWLVREGDDSTRGEPLAVIEISDCAEKLSLTQGDLLRHVSTRPRFGKPSELSGYYRDNRHIVVEIDEAEALTCGWKSGYYLAPISPEEAHRKLLGRPMY